MAIFFPLEGYGAGPHSLGCRLDGLVLQLSLLVDQEFGGLSFPVAGFGDGLMDPAPERENEVDAELSWKRVMRRRISGMLKAMNAPDLPPPFGRRVRPGSPPGRRAPASTG